MVVSQLAMLTSSIDYLTGCLFQPGNLLLTIGMPTSLIQESRTQLGRLTIPAMTLTILAAQLNLKLADKQKLLETWEPQARLDELLKHVQSEIEILQVQKRIRSRVKKQMEKTQREYYLNEQMQAIQRELGEKDEFKNELGELEAKIREKNLPEHAEEKALKELREVMEMTGKNTGTTLTLALSYGSREELTTAVKSLCTKVKNNIISPGDIDEAIINEHLYTHDLPDVDLLIRTSGEHRISNFLLWQIAYAELYFTDVFWPDFSEQHLIEALKDYQNRERRFGKTSEQLN